MWATVAMLAPLKECFSRDFSSLVTTTIGRTQDAPPEVFIHSSISSSSSSNNNSMMVSFVFKA
jgi:hypothetical protein